MVLFASTQSIPTTASMRRTFLPHHHHHHRSQRLSFDPPTRHCVRIRAIDAAQPYDQEIHLINRFTQSNKLKIAIIGFGNFGQFLAKAFIRQGHAVIAHSRSNYHSIAQSLGASFFLDPHDLFKQHPDVIVDCTSIISTESVLESLPLQRVRRSTLFVDVLSVKEFPKNILLQVLPSHFDILCTHPMFGPESGKHGWQNLPFVFDKVRIGGEDRTARVENFLDIFRKEGCEMVEMSCAEHDKHAAGSQFITHTIGRLLDKLKLESTPINTKGYETLLDLVANTGSDSFDLYYGLFMYNKNAIVQLERLDLAFEALKKELFGNLHEKLRNQLFENLEVGETLPKNGPPPPLLPPGATQSDTMENDST